MLVKDYTFNNETVTAIHRDGYYLWIATYTSSNVAKLYKVGVLNPDTTYVTVTTSFSKINKITSGASYIYITGKCGSYIVGIYNKLSPSSEYYNIVTPVGMTDYELTDLYFNSDTENLYALYPGVSGEQNTTVLKIDSNFDIITNYEITESSIEILNSTGIVYDSDNDFLWFIAEYSTTPTLYYFNCADDTAVAATVLTETEYKSLTLQNNIIYATSLNNSLTDIDVTDYENLIINYNDYNYSSTISDNLNNIFYNSVQERFYILQNNDTDIYYVDLSDLTTINLYYTHSLSLKNIEGFSDFDCLYCITNGTLVTIDNSSRSVIDTDFRTMVEVTSVVNTDLTYIQANKLETDLRTLGETNLALTTDLRYKEQEDETFINAEPRTALGITIDGNTVETVDVKLDTVQITWNTDSPSNASFIVCRKHDKPNYTNNGTLSTITNNNAIVIYFDGREIFTGKIEKLRPVCNEEQITVYCKGTVRDTYSNPVSLSLPSVGESLSLYHIIDWNCEIDKPVTDYDIIDGNGNYEQPSFYKGVKINLGIHEKEVGFVGNTWYLIDENSIVNPQSINDFTPIQNYEYFWKIQYHNAFNSFSGADKYIGKNNDAFKQLEGDLWVVDSYRYLTQRLRDNTETELGWYYLGSAPYEEVSTSNGKYTAINHWEDRADGLYWVKNEHWDNQSWCREVARARWNSMADCNGNYPNESGFYKTSADITITIEALLYYNIHLLSYINITNTTQNGIYTNANGFPVRPKSINLNFSNMTANLNCDNSLTITEQRAIEDSLGAEPVHTEESAVKKYAKFDINQNAEIV